MRFWGGVLAAVASLALFCASGSATAQPAWGEQIQTLRHLAEKDNAKALIEFQDLGRKLEQAAPEQAPYSVQRDYLIALMDVQLDAAQIAATAQSAAKLQALAVAARDDIGIVMAGIKETSLLARMGKTGAALTKLGTLESAALRSGNNEVLWRYYLSLGSNQLTAAKFESSLSNALKSLEYAWKVPEFSKSCALQSLSLLSNVYSSMMNFEKSVAVANEAMVIADDMGAVKTKATLLLNQGNTYSSLERFSESVVAYEKALVIGKQYGLVGLQATALNNLADSYLYRKNYPKSEALSHQAMAKFQEDGDMAGVATAQTNLGLARMGMGSVKSGAEQVRIALKFFQESDDKAAEESILGELGLMYEQMGQYAEAVDAIRAQQKLSKELFNADREKSVATLQEQFDSVQREKQIELLARENSLKDAELRNGRLQQVVTILGAAVTLMAGGFMYILYRRVRKANQKLFEANQRLEILSVRDPLTGLYNRRSFLDLMKHRAPASGNGRRDDSAPDGLMILDIDHFKHINDTLGHAAGDTVLVEIAKRLRSTVRDSDMVMRWGGEEFLVYSPKANPAHLQHLAQRALNVIGDTPIEVGDQSLTITVTGGFLSLPFSGLTEEECNWEKAMQIADMALYLGKVNGRNRAYGLNRILVPFEVAMPVLERDISAAIKANMVEMVEVVGPVAARATDSNP